MEKRNRQTLCRIFLFCKKSFAIVKKKPRRNGAFFKPIWIRNPLLVLVQPFLDHGTAKFGSYQ